MSNTGKMDTSEVFEMFETINKKLDKQATDKPAEPVQVDLTAVNTLTERLMNVIEEIGKQTQVEHQHRHSIDIHSNWFFFSWVILVIIIFGLFWILANQRQTVNQYRESDLKYRYIKMQGQVDEENLYNLERQFKDNDSIKIVRKQVERYEELVKEQAEKLEQTRQRHEKTEQLQKEMEELKIGKSTPY